MNFYNNNRKIIKWINQNYKIRVTDTRESNAGKRIDSIRGAGKLNEVLPEKDVLKLFESVKSSWRIKYTYWNRKNLKIEFLIK